MYILQILHFPYIYKNIGNLQINGQNDVEKRGKILYVGEFKQIMKIRLA